MKGNRRKFLGAGVAATAAGVAGVAGAAPAAAKDKAVKKVLWKGGKKPDKTPLFSSTVAIWESVVPGGCRSALRGRHQSPHETCARFHPGTVGVGRFVHGQGAQVQRVSQRPERLPGDERGVSGTIRVRAACANHHRRGRWIPGNSLVEIDVIAYV